ncbi:hypothetical protein Tco_0556415 [Tanacetum coccineum]
MLDKEAIRIFVANAAHKDMTSTNWTITHHTVLARNAALSVLKQAHRAERMTSTYCQAFLSYNNSPKSKLDEDLQGTPIDATLYRGMIGSLMYLTSSRPDLIYAACLCARYQAKPTEKNLNAVKWIFQYLKGTINMGLWYSKDNGMSMTAMQMQITRGVRTLDAVHQEVLNS